MLARLLTHIALATLLAVGAAVAQVSPQPAQNIPLPNSTLGTTDVNLPVLHTFTAAAPATFSTGILQNLNGKGVQCKYNRTAESGSPSSTMSIQAYDAASQTFTTWLTTATSATSPVELTAQVFPGIQTTSLPTNMVAISLHLPKWFRVQLVTTGSSTTHTGTLGCDILE